MDHFAGLDVSVKETSVCIVDDTGKIVREVKVASEPDVLLAVLTNPAYHFKRIGLAIIVLKLTLNNEIGLIGP
jgi:transposase